MRLPRPSWKLMRGRLLVHAVVARQADAGHAGGRLDEVVDRAVAGDGHHVHAHGVAGVEAEAEEDRGAEGEGADLEEPQVAAGALGDLADVVRRGPGSTAGTAGSGRCPRCGRPARGSCPRPRPAPRRRRPRAAPRSRGWCWPPAPPRWWRAARRRRRRRSWPRTRSGPTTPMGIWATPMKFSQLRWEARWTSSEWWAMLASGVLRHLLQGLAADLRRLFGAAGPWGARGSGARRRPGSAPAPRGSGEARSAVARRIGDLAHLKTLFRSLGGTKLRDGFRPRGRTCRS